MDEIAHKKYIREELTEIKKMIGIIAAFLMYFFIVICHNMEWSLLPF